MTFDHDFCNSFTFSSSLFFLGGKIKGEKNNQSLGKKSCLSAPSIFAQPLNKRKQKEEVLNDSWVESNLKV